VQKQTQTAESELIELQTALRVLEGEVQVLEREKRILANDNALLEEELRSNIREIEVIREVPSLDENGHSSDQENKLSDERIENAKRLVFAFKKGVSENQNASAEEG
jgi:predicted RNA methylase